MPERIEALGRFGLALKRVGPYALVVGPAFILGEMTYFALRAHSLAVDAVHSYLPAARRLVDGSSPYRPGDLARGFVFASPPIAGFLFAPFTLVSQTAAEVLLALVMLGVTFLALRLVGVTDWRGYGAAALSAPLVGEFQTANLSALLALCAAVVWRYRDRAWAAGAAAGIGVALKLVPWPLIVFLLLTRRFRAAAWASGIALAGILIPWAAVGFAGFRSYPGLLGQIDRVEGAHGYSLAALIAHLSGWGTAQAVSYVIGGLLLLLALRLRADARTFIVCVAAMLLLTPIVWMHYFVLVFVVLGVARPEFSAIWAAPWILWISAHEGPADWWQGLVVLCVAGALFLVAYRGARSVRGHEHSRHRTSSAMWRYDARTLARAPR
jgi:glycosyl transferase family 87